MFVLNSEFSSGIWQLLFKKNFVTDPSLGEFDCRTIWYYEPLWVDGKTGGC